MNIATLKARLSEYIRMARQGETVQILDRRRPVARLSGTALPRGLEAARTLVEEGLAQWQGGKPRVRPVKPRKGPVRIGEAVFEDRE